MIITVLHHHILSKYISNSYYNSSHLPEKESDLKMSYEYVKY